MPAGSGRETYGRSVWFGRETGHNRVSLDIAQAAQLVRNLLLGIFDFQPLEFVFNRAGHELVEAAEAGNRGGLLVRS